MLREYVSKRKVIIVSKQKQAKIDFKEVLRRFHKWLLDEAELKPNSADQYKGYIKKLCAAVDEAFGPERFESLALDYVRDLSEQELSLCSVFIESQIRNCPRKYKKAWNDWRSAFRRFEEFLFDITDSWNAYPKVDKQQRMSYSVATGLPRPADKRPAKIDGDKRIVVATYTHDELCRVFLGRLKTQSRYYPEFGLFPTRLLTKIFKNTRPNEWITWLKNGIENMHMLKDEKGHYEVVSSVKKLVIFDEGTVVVTLKDNSTFELMTRTVVKRNGRGVEGPIVKERAERGLRDVSIDHIRPLENVLRQIGVRLVGLKKLTELFFMRFKRDSGEHLDPRAEREWAKAFFEQCRGKLDTDEMRALIIADLNALAMEYELMDTRENSKKGKNGML